MSSGRNSLEENKSVEEDLFFDAESIKSNVAITQNESEQILSRKIRHSISSETGNNALRTSIAKAKARNGNGLSRENSKKSLVSALTSNSDGSGKDMLRCDSVSSLSDSVFSNDDRDHERESGDESLSSNYSQDNSLESSEKVQNDSLTEPSNKRVSETSSTSVLRRFFSRSSLANDVSGNTAYVKAVNKSEPEFSGLVLAQSLRVHDGSVWVLKFSPDGQYLASGGQDGKIIIWTVGNVANGVDLEVPSVSGKDTTPDHFELVNSSPYRIFNGHSADVTDCSWSKSNFLLSASVDKTVRLWHVSRDDCLQVFKHFEIVTGVAFHPTHDRYFVSGCFDRRVRIWDIIPDGVVKDWCLAPDVITAVNFTPDGSMVTAGLFYGQVFFYDYDGLKYITQILCNNRRGVHKEGRKVTGLVFMKSGVTGKDDSGAFTPKKASSTSAPEANSTVNAAALNGAVTQLLVSTNDSRLRLINMTDYSLQCKYKGLSNDSMQINGSFSENGRYIISGSENGKVFIWNTTMSEKYGIFNKLLWGLGRSKMQVQRNSSYEYFYSCGKKGPGRNKEGADSSVNGNACIAAMFAPASAVLLACPSNRVDKAKVNISNLCSSVIVTGNSQGSVRVFVKKFW